MANKPFFFISGMYRSGSTLLANMLLSHPELAVASDAYGPLFKAFRNQIVNTTEPGQAFDPDTPLGDYYFSLRDQVFFDAIKNASLDTRVTSVKLFTLQEQIRLASMNSAPKIHPFLDTLSGDTFADLIRAGVDIVREAYGDEQTTMTGFKEVRTNEFVPHILNHFSDAKAILLQRDPRAVAASQNAAHEKHPWIFLARQWRKATSLAWLMTQSTFPHRDRVLVLKYETLIRRPKETAEEICSFLEIPFHENLLDPEQFVDGDGNAWSQSSDYVRGMQKFNSDSITKWREVLTVSDCDFMERMCWPEMNLYQYEPAVMQNWVLLEEMIKRPPLLSDHELVDWIKPYSISSKHEYVEELRKERRRWDALTDEHVVDEDTQKTYCLDPSIFSELRAIVSNTKSDLEAPVIDDGE